MKIFVRAKINAKRPGVEKLDERNFLVAVSEPPIDGRANRAIVSALAEYFHIAKSRVNLVVGASGKNKIFEIND
ncbi:MAG: DUF167 domain-containing protein [Patescibacteria group bacterium]